jgi:hypothetical protein
MKLAIEAGILIALGTWTFLVGKDGLQRAGYEIGGFISQVSAGYHREPFTPDGKGP